MNVDLNALLENLQRYCLAKAVRTPSPADPAPQEWENAADDYVRMFARQRVFDGLTPEAAAAMIPRTACAIVAASPIKAAYTAASSFGDAAATEERMLEDLLIDTWHQNLKPGWISGKIVLRQMS